MNYRLMARLRKKAFLKCSGIIFKEDGDVKQFIKIHSVLYHLMEARQLNPPMQLPQLCTAKAKPPNIVSKRNPSIANIEARHGIRSSGMLNLPRETFQRWKYKKQARQRTENNERCDRQTHTLRVLVFQKTQQSLKNWKPQRRCYCLIQRRLRQSFSSDSGGGDRAPGSWPDAESERAVVWTHPCLSSIVYPSSWFSAQDNSGTKIPKLSEGLESPSRLPPCRRTSSLCNVQQALAFSPKPS